MMFVELGEEFAKTEEFLEAGGAGTSRDTGGNRAVAHHWLVEQSHPGSFCLGYLHAAVAGRWPLADRYDYSTRRASIGLMLDARRAGK